MLVFVLWIPLGSIAQEKNSKIVIGKYDRIYSEILEEERTIKITLPHDYNNSNEKYPVLYVLDAEWKPFYARIYGTVDHMNELNDIPRMIIVGICNTVRNRDMIPAKVIDRPNSGGSDKFLGFITEELMPYFDSKYRTESPNVLFGGSNAGLFTVYAILTRPDRINYGIAGSPMIGHCPDYMNRLIDGIDDLNRFKNRALFMIYGEHDYSRTTEFVPEYFARITGKRMSGFRCELEMIKNDGHVPYLSLFNGLKYVFRK